MSDSGPWVVAEAPVVLPAQSVTIIDGTTFAVSDPLGDMQEELPQGLFVRDVRLLSTWRLTVDGRRPEPVAVATMHPFEAVSVGEVELGGGDRLLVVRTRSVGNGLREELRLVSASPTALSVRVGLAVGSDLADLFEVKDGRSVAREVLMQVRPDGLSVQAPSLDSVGEVVVHVRPDAADTVITQAGLSWHVDLEPRGGWTSGVDVAVSVAGEELPFHHRRGSASLHPSAPVQRHRAWRAGAPRLDSTDPRLSEVVRRGVEDLGTLRVYDPVRPRLPVVAAGSPWFMALFGRDSLLTSLMTLPLGSDVALGTLTALAARQGRVEDPVTEEAPGKILHEVRFGPVGALTLGGRQVYYGSVDATPLFVVLLGAVARWRGFDERVAALLPHADAALAWMETYGDRDRDGFLEYHRSRPEGLLNQGWKDSKDSVAAADGTLAEGPVALVEVQGYAYAAMRARVHLAELQGDPATAERWRDRAAELKRRFDAAFWLEDLQRYALALDGDKRPVDAEASNVGHCLWTGIVDPRRAAAVAASLTSRRMASGWGLRTLSTAMARYDPLSYHNGSVWPHDTAIAVAGLARYGFPDAAARLASGLLEAAQHFDERLPELFGGHDRDLVPIPVPYRAACSPQAWASASFLGILTSLLGLTAGSGLRARPALPLRWAPLTWDGLVVQGRRWRVQVDADGRTARVASRAPR